MERPESWYNCTCPECGKKFHLKPCAAKRYKSHCCSMECNKNRRRKLMSGDGNHQYGLLGNKNPTWKTDIKINRYGYLMERRLDHPFAGEHGWMFQHRLIAEQHLLTDENSVTINGVRYLSKDYDVHHKNMDRLDNRVENLMVMTKHDHRSYHSKLNAHERTEKGMFKKMTEILRAKKVRESATIPERKSIGAAGYDLTACVDERVTILPHHTVSIPSGIAFQIPKGYFGAIYARSGLATKMGLRPATCVSVIDSDYRGEVGLPLHNDTDKIKYVEPGERIAQIVFQKALTPEIELVDSLDETERGANGFGSTGR